MAPKKTKPKRLVKPSLLPTFLIRGGVVAIVLGLVTLLFIFLPVIRVEIGYLLYSLQRGYPGTSAPQTSAQKPLEPASRDFGIVIPKIGANAAVVANVDPYDSHQYQVALTRGVAHARGTVFPGEPGNIFLFSHSSANVIDAARYNSIFFLLTKLEKDDEIILYYKNEKFRYTVTEKKIVEASAVSYLSPRSTGKTLTLMTCWPPGTTFKRLLVIAEL